MDETSYSKINSVLVILSAVYHLLYEMADYIIGAERLAEKTKLLYLNILSIH